MTTDPATPPSADGGPDRAPTGRGRRVWRRVGIAVGGLVALIALVVVGVLIYLQTGAGQTFARGLVVTQIQNLLADDAEVSAEGLSGNFLTGAQLTGFEIARGGETVVAVDTVLIDYNLRTLLSRTFSASQLAVAGPRVFVRQRADSTFNVAGLLKPAERESSGFTVLLDQVAVRDGRAEVHWYRADGRDSVHTVADLGAVIRDFRLDADSLVGDIEALRLRALAPFDAGELAVAGSGRFSREDLALRGLSVTSRAGTDLSGTARLTFVSGGTLPVFDAALVADPLALEDARAFAGVEVYGDPRLRLRADSDGDVLTASLAGTLADATISLDGEFSRRTDGPVEYRAEGTLRRFDPSVLTRDPATAAQITGDLRLDLRGTTLETLSGPFSINLTESRVAERQIDRLRLDGSFAAGRVTFDLDGALPGASLVAEGRARPFDESPTFEVAGTARDLDLGLLLPGSGRTDSFAGDFAVEGQGTTADDFRGTAALDLSRVDIGLPDRRLQLQSFVADAVIDRGTVTFLADARLPGNDGRVVADGVATLGEPLTYQVTDGQLYGLNVAALTGDPAQASSLTGSFTVQGEGTDPTASPIDVTVTLQNSRFGEFALDAVDLALALRGGVADVDLAANLGAAGSVTAVGTARPFADPLAYDLRGTVQNLDLAELTGNPDQYSDLTASYEIDGAGIDPATLTLDARLQITAPSSYGERFVDSGDVRVTLDGGALALNGTLETPEGGFDLAITGRPFDGDAASFALDDTCFRDLDLSRFAEAAPRTDLTGCFSGQIAGFGDLATANASGVLSLRPSTISEAEVDAGTVRFTLDDGALGGTAELAVVGADGQAGRLVSSFQGRPFAETPSYAVRGRTEALDVGTLLDLPPDQPVVLSLDFDVTGRGTDPATMALAGSVTGGGSTLGPVAVDTLATRFALADGVVSVDTLRFESDLGRAVGGGTLALFDEDAASDFRLSGSVQSLAPLASLTEETLGLESAEFSLVARAQPGAPIEIVGSAQARQLVFGETSVTGLDAAVDGSWNRALADSLGLGALSGGATASFDVLTQGTFVVRSGDARISTDDTGDVLVDASVVVDDRRELAVDARVDPVTNGIELERGELLLDGDTWNLLQPAQITAQDGLIEVRQLLLASESGGQQVSVDGVVDLEGEQDLAVTVENLAIGTLTDLAGLDALGGDLSATLTLTGPAAAPLVDGTVTLADLTSRGRTVGALRADVDYADGRLTLDAALTHVDGEALTIDGVVPLQFSLADADPTVEGGVADDAEVSLRARADGFPIGWARPFLDDETYTALGGTLRLDVRIEGTQAAPQLDGVATLTDGTLGVAATGRVYSPISADLTFQNDRIVVEDVTIKDESGRTALDVVGDIRLRELSVGELDLTITPRQFVALDTRTFQDLTLDRGSSPIRLTGTLDRPVLRGAVVLAQGDIFLTDELVPPDLEAVTLTDAQLREVEARFGRVIAERDTAVNRFTDALDYDLAVEIRRDVWLRSNNGLPFDIEFEGTVDARKGAYAEGSRLFGTVDLVRGSVETLNRQFEIDTGRIVFNGDPLGARVALDAELDVKLAGSVAGQSSATITLGVSGRFDQDLTIRFSANPAMEQADIVSLIATGRLADDVFGAGAAGNLAGGVALGRVSSVLEGAASEGLGLETAQIDYEGNDLVIKIGDYLSTRAFWTAGVIVPVGGTNQNERGLPIILGLDYQLYQWLSAQTEYSGQRGVGGGLGFEQAW